MSGIELIAQERKEQIEKHKRTVEEDKKFNTKFQLTRAAAILIDHNDKIWGYDRNMVTWFTPTGWNKTIWEKMCAKSYKDRLVIAGALIAAELDRITENEDTKV